MEYLQESHYSEGLCNVIHNGKYGFIDKNNQIIIPFIYDWAFEFSETLASVLYKGKYGYINKKNEVVIPFQYDFAFSFVNGFAWVMKDKMKGFIDKEGNLVVDYKYDTVTYTDDNKIIVSKFDSVERFGLLDLDLNIISECVHENMEDLL